MVPDEILDKLKGLRAPVPIEANWSQKRFQMRRIEVVIYTYSQSGALAKVAEGF